MFSDLTTMGVGGPVGRLAEVPDLAALRDVLKRADAEGDSVLVLGAGSNLVVSDEGFGGTVVRLAMKGCRFSPEGDFVQVEVGAGEDWPSFVARCVAEGLSGVECLAGIPGTAGATPVQNVGAYGQEVSQTVTHVAVWDRDLGCARRLPWAQCDFGYRTSIFKRQPRYVVTAVTFCLRRSEVSQPLAYEELARELGSVLGARLPLREVSEAVLELRRQKGMVLDPSDPDTKSAGSFFTNPILSDAQMSELAALAPAAPSFAVAGGTKVPAAWLVEHAGFSRGYQMGRAAISSKHTLAITARAGATAAEVVALARAVRDGVAARFGVRLEAEPVLVGLRI